jgi:hypothetical protein
MKISFDLSWLVLLFVILKVTGLIHCSWWWIGLPFGIIAFFGLVGILFGLLGMGIALVALAFFPDKVKWTIKK